MDRETLKDIADALNKLWCVYDSKIHMTDEEVRDFAKLVKLQNKVEQELGWRK